MMREILTLLGEGSNLVSPSYDLVDAIERVI